MEVNYIQHSGTDLTVVNAARTSFNKTSSLQVDGTLSDKDKKLIGFLAREQHFAPFEHLTATLHLKVPIFIARQIHRHRTFSYSEVSRRYVDEAPMFYWPEVWRKRAANIKQGSSEEIVTELPPYPNYDDPLSKRAIPMFTAQQIIENQARQWYKEMLKAGIAPEQARMVLPQNVYTEFWMSGDLRAWAHFIVLRKDAHAQQEVQVVANRVAEKLRTLWPTSCEVLGI